jgi:hypothetical protein
VASNYSTYGYAAPSSAGYSPAYAEEVGSSLDLGQPVTIPQEGSVDYGSASNDYAASAGAGCSGCGSNQCDGSCSGYGPLLDAHQAYGLPAIGRPNHWFGGVYGLIMFRDDDSRGVVLGFDDADPFTPLLTTGSARMEDAGGFEVRIGHMLNHCLALEAVYWGVFPDDTEANVLSSQTPGNVNSAINFTGIDYDNGGGAQPLDNLFQGTQRLRLRRAFEYHNVELNLLRVPFVLGADSRARMAFLIGARYFRADDSFSLASDFANETFGDDPANEVSYSVDVDNHLAGFQVGGVLDYVFCRNFSGHVSTKFGVYNNHMSIYQTIQAGDGTTAVINAGPFAGQAFVVDDSKDDVAYLGELDAGLAYNLSCKWRVTGGYRVAALSGVALATSQIGDFTDLASAANIDDHDSLILHGAYAGLEFVW